MPTEDYQNTKGQYSVPLSKALLYICIGVALGLFPTIFSLVSYPTIVLDRASAFEWENQDAVSVSPFECVNKFLAQSSDQIAMKNDGNAVDNLKTPVVVNGSSGSTVDIKAINISRELIYAMTYNLLFEDPNNSYYGYRVYFGKKPMPGGGQKDVGILHPLNSLRNEISGLNTFKVVDIPAETAGPCPDICG